MQLHLPHETHWQLWARGIAIVMALLAGPIVLAVTWLAVIRGLL